MGELPFLAGEQGRGPLLLLLFFVSVTILAIWGTWEGTLPASREAILALEAKQIWGSGDVVDRGPAGMVFENPPLTLWITGIFYSLLGTNIFTSRIAFVLFSLLTCFVVYLAGERIEELDSAVSDVGEDQDLSDGWKDKAHCMGLMTAAVFALTPLAGRFVPHLNAGVILSFFVALSLLGWLYLPAVRSGYILWMVGLAGGMASGGAAALLVIPASLISLSFDRTRRGLWTRWRFLFLTALAIVLGWVLVDYAPGGSWKLDGRPGLWALLYSLGDISVENLKNLAVHSFGFWIKTLPWSIPAAAAVFRMIVLEPTGRIDTRTSPLDKVLLIYMVVLLIPLAMVYQVDSGATLLVVPAAVLLSAREITRWLKNDLQRVWSFNRMTTAIFSLLVILLVITPMQFHRFEDDPIEEVARAANHILGRDETIGNYRQNHDIQEARLLFYGDRSLDHPVHEPSEVREKAEENPGKVFLAEADDLASLEQSEWLGGRLDIVYGTETLVLFRIPQEEGKY